MLHIILEGTINHVPIVKLRSFVDDICQTSYGPDALEDMIDSAKELVTGFRTAGLKISTKSKILSTSRDWGRILARSLAKMGVTVSVTRQAKDLGIDTTIGIRRATSTIKKRILSARKRTFRIKILRQATYKAAKLLPSGAMPQASYGKEGMGISPNQVSVLRAMAASAVSSHYPYMVGTGTG